MKGVITEINNDKSIVLFNNGKIGTIPTPKNAGIGTTVKVSKNRGGIFVFAALVAAIVIAFLIAYYIYNKPIGYFNIISGNTRIEFTYNHFERIIDSSPLTPPSVEVVAKLSPKNKKIDDVLSSFLNSENDVWVYIADDNLDQAQEIENRLAKLSGEMPVHFKLCSLELCRKIMEAGNRKSIMPRHKGRFGGRHKSFGHPPF